MYTTGGEWKSVGGTQRDLSASIPQTAFHSTI